MSSDRARTITCAKPSRPRDMALRKKELCEHSSEPASKMLYYVSPSGTHSGPSLPKGQGPLHSKSCLRTPQNILSNTVPFPTPRILNKWRSA